MSAPAVGHYCDGMAGDGGSRQGHKDGRQFLWLPIRDLLQYVPGALLSMLCATTQGTVGVPLPPYYIQIQITTAHDEQVVNTQHKPPVSTQSKPQICTFTVTIIADNIATKRLQLLPLASLPHPSHPVQCTIRAPPSCVWRRRYKGKATHRREKQPLTASHGLPQHPVQESQVEPPAG